jgi:6-pyruvoyltetrahydropterin/6-carboxytetrahydropterin synthase
VFGACNNVNTHGHNYLLEVTLCGDIDPVTGMIINLYDLKLYLWEVLKEFDHKNLNLDTPYFHDRIPTSENLAWRLWELLAKHPQLPALEKIRLYEDATLYAEVTQDFIQSSSSANTALIGRRYQFAAVHQSAQGPSHGHQYELWVSIKGTIPHDTGQIVSLPILDQIVNREILDRWEQKNISHDPLFSDTPITDLSLAKQSWSLLRPHFSTPPLHQVSISQRSETFATFSE